MNRRDFLTIAAAAVPTALILPELLLPRRTFFLPPAGGWLRSSDTGLLSRQWLDYAETIRPVGLLVVAEIGDVKTPTVSENYSRPGVVVLQLPRHIDAETESKMLRNFANPPSPHPYGATLADLIPWEFPWGRT